MPTSPAEWLFAILGGALTIIQCLLWKIVNTFENRIVKLEEFQRNDKDNIMKKLSDIEKHIESIRLNIEERFVTRNECDRLHALRKIEINEMRERDE